MKPDELRSAYLSFFEAKGHTRWPSASLVPDNDPTLLFTGAGMNQFKEMFLGIGNLPFQRATTAQKCFRTGDLDNVGRTFYHHTFFEMLGNFSFGDYFKREAIQWAHEFVTGVLRLPVERLWVSVYQDDTEALAIWRDEIGFPERKIWRLGPKSNFWPANAPEDGPDGPCGPCSEIFWDYGSPGAEGDPDASRYCEFWNLVFAQFNRVGKNRLEPLRQKNIDTGMGFERMCAILNGRRSNFETELFLPILRAVAEIADRPYRFEDPSGPLFRRIADHLRAAVFLVADGVKPSNEGRGYVARRILRRAVRDAINLGIDRTFLHELAPVVVSIMGSAYPELRTAQPAAIAFLEAEEEKFRSTYEAGMNLLRREIDALRASGRSRLAGETAFALYDSHGFPLELSEEILAEHGLGVDRAAFDACMEAQRSRSREGSSMGGEVFVATAVSDLKRTVPPTVFLGHRSERADGRIAAILRDETRIERASASDGDLRIVALETPFYAEAGGQVGDTGAIEGPSGLFRVTDTRKVEGYILHFGRMERGTLAAGETASFGVDGVRRSRIRRNHTATHLLHAALREVLGRHVTQAGSLVAPDRLRFDFTHPRAVTREELERIERRVNEQILRDAEVTTEVKDLEEARRSGAMALFGEKYDPKVRVVSVADVSMELCGGTHVGRVGEIGPFVLLQESSVASGVRRIEATTGEGAFECFAAHRLALRGVAEALKTTPELVRERVEALQQELKELRRRESDRSREGALASAEALLANASRRGSLSIVVGSVPGDEPALLRSLADELRKRAGECFILLAGTGPEGAAILATATPAAVAAGLRAGDVAREFAAGLGGKAGGKPDLAQGKVPGKGVEAALGTLRTALAAR